MELEHDLADLIDGSDPDPPPSPKLPCGCRIATARLQYISSVIKSLVPQSGPVDVTKLAKNNSSGAMFGVNETGIVVGHIQNSHADPSPC